MTDENKQTALDIVGSKNSLKAIMSQADFQESVKLVASKYMTAEKIMKAALLALSRQPKLLNCTKVSFLQSTIKAAESGLDFGGSSGQGFLVPYWNSKIRQLECQFQPGYQGYIEVAYRGGKVGFIDAQLVHKNDKYDYELGTKPFIKHKPILAGDRGEIIFGYAVAYLTGSNIPKIEIMTNAELDSIKNRTKSKTQSGEIVGPWITDDPEMRRKTLIRRIYKYLPKTPEMQAILETDQEIEFTGVTAEELLADNSNLGANGLKGRLKKHIEIKEVSKEPTPTEEGKQLKQKAKEEIEKLKQAEQQKPKMYKCTNKETCGNTLMENQLEITNEGVVCPDCGMPVEEINA